MKTPRLFHLGVACLLLLTTCEKKEITKNSDKLSHEPETQDTVVQRQVDPIPEGNEDMSKNMGDIHKLIGKGMIHTEADWAKLKASYWPSSWDSAFTKDSFKSVGELMEDHDYEFLLRKVAKRDLADLTNDEAQCLSIWFTASLVSAYSPADSLPNAFAVRGETPYPTKGDLIMYVLFKDSYSNKESRSLLNSKQKEQWEKISNSPNPVVRLLAAETYLHVEENHSDWNEFYSTFSGDSDPYVLEKAVHALYTAGTYESIKVLEEFDKSEVIRENPQLRQKVASMIQSLQKNAVGK